MPGTLTRPIRNAELDRDPTGTISVRREFSAAGSTRYRTLKGIIRDGVAGADVFGIGERQTAQQTEAARQTLNELRRLAREAGGAGDLDRLRTVARNFVLTPGRFDFPAADQVETFGEWLRIAQESHVLEVARDAAGDVVTQNRWERVYVRRGYVKGLFDADQKLNAAGIDVPDADPAAVVRLPVHTDALELLHQRAFSDLTGITDATAQTIRRELAQGFAEGINPNAMASRINGRIDAIGIHRARVLARTEVVRAHAEATLNRFEQFGVEEVAGRAEFATAGDDRVSNVRWSLIETEDGPKPIQKIRPGDRVWTREGLREVVATSVRPYSGGFVRIEVERRAELCTVEHPVWTREEGWLEAGEVEVGHTVETFGDGPVEVTGVRHFEVRDPDDRESFVLKVLRLPLVGLRALLVPIETVHLKGDIEIRKQEVNRVPAHLGFLAKLKAEVDQGVTNKALRRGLAFVLSVARHGAETAAGFFRRDNPERLAAMDADVEDGRPSTLFGAVLAIVAPVHVGLFVPEPRSASFAFSPLPLSGGVPASRRTVGISFLDRLADLEVFATLGAGLFDGLRFFVSRVAAPRTEAVPMVPGVGAVGLAAPLARGIRNLSLPLPATLSGAESVRGPGIFSGIAATGVRFAAFVADKCKRHWWDLRRWIHVTLCKITGLAPVYNLQVEGPEEYFSSGILVKNCPICEGLEGTVFTIDEARGVIPAHAQCRCTWLPLSGFQNVRTNVRRWLTVYEPDFGAVGEGWMAANRRVVRTRRRRVA